MILSEPKTGLKPAREVHQIWGQRKKPGKDWRHSVDPPLCEPIVYRYYSNKAQGAEFVEKNKKILKNLKFVSNLHNIYMCASM